mgnify:CR=1 FL=1
MSTPITTREDLTRIQWFAMSAYKTRKRRKKMLKGKDGLEYFIPKHYAVRVYHGVKSKRLVPVIPNLSSCMLPENRSRISKKNIISYNS